MSIFKIIKPIQYMILLRILHIIQIHQYIRVFQKLSYPNVTGHVKCVQNFKSQSPQKKFINHRYSMKKKWTYFIVNKLKIYSNHNLNSLIFIKESTLYISSIDNIYNFNVTVCKHSILQKWFMIMILIFYFTTIKHVKMLLLIWLYAAM